MNKRLLLTMPIVALCLSMCDDGEADARERAKQEADARERAEQIDGRMKELGGEFIGTMGESFISGVRIGVGDVSGGIDQFKDAWDRKEKIKDEASKLNTEERVFAKNMVFEYCARLYGRHGVSRLFRIEDISFQCRGLNEASYQ